MEENPLVSYVLATYNRRDELRDAVDSILEQPYDPLEVVVVSSSTDSTDELFESGGRFDDERVRYHEFEEDAGGPPEARNLACDLADGEIIVTIDDDAVLADPESTNTIVSRFREHEDVGILAFQSRDYYTDELVRFEIPDPPDLVTPPTEEYRTSAFIGVGVAFRRSVFEDAGDFPTSFIYGFEEMDLSIRALDAGYDILYVPSLVVRHKKSPKARRSESEVIRRHIENRLRLSVRNLPWRYVICSTLIWSLYGIVRSKFRPEPVLTALRSLYEDREELLDQRKVVDEATIKLVKSRASMLYGWWYGPHPNRIFGEHGDLERLTW